MRKSILLLACSFLSLTLCAAQNALPSNAETKPAQGSPVGPDDLKNVLAQLDKAALTIKSAKAKFQSDQYQAAVKKTDVKKGEILFHRAKSGMEATVRVISPAIRQIALVDGDPKPLPSKMIPMTVSDDVQRSEIESLMSIGFGSRSDDLVKSYVVTMEGWETVDGVKTARLNLVPKNVLKDPLTNIILWLDPVRDVPLRQKFLEPGGDFLLAHYTNIEIDGADDLKIVFAESDKAATTFKTAKAKFQWDQYERVVEQTDVQKGEIYFRRTKGGMDAAVRVTSPDTKQVTFVDGTLKLFQPTIKQLTIYDAKARRTEVESLMNIGFGTRSEDILKSYEVKMEGWETVDGVKTARLNLVPKNEKLKASVTNIILWLDPQRDISLQQKFIEPGGNYRLTHYTDIEINGKIPNDVFELKTPAGTTTVRP